MAKVFVTGGTGFMGQRLTAELLGRGHAVKVLARAGSMGKVCKGTEAVVGDPLDANSYRHHVTGCDTWAHLVGVTKPAPWKEKEFQAVDLAAAREMAKILPESGVRHVVYVSVAQPAPMMHAYIRVRQECEQRIAQSGVAATTLRPWYVLGPGRRWPLVLAPFYKLAEALGSSGAQRLGLVTLEQMICSMVWAVENPGSRILDVPAIRRIRERGQVAAVVLG